MSEPTLTFHLPSFVKAKALRALTFQSEDKAHTVARSQEVLIWTERSSVLRKLRHLPPSQPNTCRKLPPPAPSGSPLQPEEVEEVVPPTCSAASQKCPTSISPEIPRRPLKGADTSAVGELQVSAVTSKDSENCISVPVT